MRLFEKEADYEAFEVLVNETLQTLPMRICACCVMPTHWIDLVNLPEHDSEVESVRRCIRRGRPLGNDVWVRNTAGRLGLESSLRAPHRPRKSLDAT